jgi:hypothetical protein
LKAKKPKHPIPFNALKGGPLSTKRIVIPSVIILNSLLGIVAVFLVILLLSGVIGRIKTVQLESPNAAVRVSIYKQLISEITKERIKNSLDVYKYIQGTLPDQIDILTKNGLLEERDLQYPFKMKYKYKKDGDNVIIENLLY